jgi:hypothetical protein
MGLSRAPFAVHCSEIIVMKGVKLQEASHGAHQNKKWKYLMLANVVDKDLN